MQFAHITCSLHTNMATHRHTGPSDRRHITRITNIALTQTTTLHSQVLPNITLTQTRTLHARRVLFDAPTFVVAHITHADRIDQSYYRTYRAHSQLTQMSRSHRSLSHTYHSYHRFLQWHRLEHRTHVECHRVFFDVTTQNTVLLSSILYEYCTTFNSVCLNTVRPPIAYAYCTVLICTLTRSP